MIRGIKEIAMSDLDWVGRTEVYWVPSTSLGGFIVEFALHPCVNGFSGMASKKCPILTVTEQTSPKELLESSCLENQGRKKSSLS